MAAEKHPGAGHRARLRDKFLEHGLAKFKDDEVLELLLTLATPRRDCKQEARALLEACGSLSAVLEADPAELRRVEGIGPKNVLGLKLIPEVAKLYLADRLRARARPTPDQVVEWLRLELLGLTREVFKVILMDRHHKVLATEEMARGTLDQAAVYPREVVARALALGAGAAICAHNHPGGSAQPSPEDLELTRRLYGALGLVGVELVDHLVVGGGQVYSFAAEGRMAALAREWAGLGL